jgi:RNA polymerase sigma-70 factor (ECF subfamily)
MVFGHMRIIYKICNLYAEEEDREDLKQEIIYQLWKSYPNFRGDSKFQSWMYRIALNTAIAKYRKKQIITETIIPERMVAEASEHPERERLYRAIGTLNEADKAVVTLYLDDYQYEEIADILGISTSHVGVKLHRIKEKLVHLLNPRTHDT